MVPVSELQRPGQGTSSRGGSWRGCFGRAPGVRCLLTGTRRDDLSTSLGRVDVMYSRSRGHGFNSQPRHFHLTTLPKLLTPVCVPLSDQDARQ